MVPGTPFRNTNLISFKFLLIYWPVPQSSKCARDGNGDFPEDFRGSKSMITDPVENVFLQKENDLRFGGST